MFLNASFEKQMRIKDEIFSFHISVSMLSVIKLVKYSEAYDRIKTRSQATYESINTYEYA